MTTSFYLTVTTPIIVYTKSSLTYTLLVAWTLNNQSTNKQSHKQASHFAFRGLLNESQQHGCCQWTILLHYGLIRYCNYFSLFLLLLLFHLSCFFFLISFASCLACSVLLVFVFVAACFFFSFFIYLSAVFPWVLGRGSLLLASMAGARSLFKALHATVFRNKVETLTSHKDPHRAPTLTTPAATSPRHGKNPQYRHL